MEYIKAVLYFKAEEQWSRSVRLPALSQSQQPALTVTERGLMMCLAQVMSHSDDPISSATPSDG